MVLRALAKFFATREIALARGEGRAAYGGVAFSSFADALVCPTGTSEAVLRALATFAAARATALARVCSGAARKTPPCGGKNLKKSANLPGFRLTAARFFGKISLAFADFASPGSGDARIDTSGKANDQRDPVHN